MDEIDAALDFKNVSIVANYIKVSLLLRIINLWVHISYLWLKTWSKFDGMIDWFINRLIEMN